MGRVRNALDRAMCTAATGGAGSAPPAASRAYNAGNQAARLAADTSHHTLSSAVGIATAALVIAVDRVTPVPLPEGVEHATFTTDAPKKGRWGR